MSGLRRRIDGFHQDEVGDWVAELSCLHGQHVRHRPPFQDRPWVESAAGRKSRLGTDIDCPLCDRAELPADVVVARTVGPFDQSTVPAGLRRDHRVAARTWGRVKVLSGAVSLTIDVEPRLEVRLAAGDAHPIPPGVTHALVINGPVRLTIDFLVRRGPRPGPVS